MMFIRERIGKLLEYLEGMIYTDEVAVDRFKMKKLEKHFGDYAYPDTSVWDDFDGDMMWGGHQEYYCFATHIRLDERFSGKCVVFEVMTGREGEWDATNPQFSIYLNGRLIQGLDVNHREIVISEDALAGEEYDILLTAFTGDSNFRLKLDARLKVLHRDVEKYYYDINVPYMTAKLLNPDSRDYYNIINALNDSLNLLDLRVEHSEGFYASLRLAGENIQKNFYEKYCGEASPVTYCVGHTHIDCAWLWTMSVTRDKALRSFSTVLELMKQYPEYKFMSSQPLLYKFVKEAAPEKYEEIKRRAAEGRWEPEGGMYVEADCNLSSGESFIRQILYGKRFFKEEFGADSKILWLPDVFGYSAALPQIMKKCGIDYFMTTKISWNELNKMPYDTFMWEGIDGSRVLTHFVPTRDYNTPAVDGGTATAHYTTYVGFLTPSHVMGGWQRYGQKYLNEEVMMTYGYGDGGGGPTRQMLETQRRLEKGIPGCPRTKISTAREFFDTLDTHVKDKKYLPHWVGELYLEYHRGTYTSMARNKRYNRRSEFACCNLELYGVMDYILNNRKYPGQALEECWEIILKNQFHDILPGSSIKEVYDDSKHEYEALLEKTGSLTKNALKNIADNVDAPKGSLVVFNPDSFTADSVVRFTGEYKAPVIIDGEQKVQTQRLNDGGFVFNAANIPSKGYRSFEIVEAGAEFAEDYCNDACKNYDNADSDAGDFVIERGPAAFDKRFLENKYYRITFDEKGHMRSIFDKNAKRELLKNGQNGNVIMTYEDRPHNFDAWDVNNYYEEKSWEADDITQMCITEKGPVLTTLKITRKYLDSTIVQYITIYEENPRIDIRHEIDWRQKQIFVKLLFPVDIHANEATYEIQYGNVKRPTHYNTSWDAARFEVCMHKWVDLSEDDYGVSILNDCKYGISIHDGNIGVSLLKSAIYPNPQADKERHEFTISLLPHKGGFKEAHTIRQAYLLNNPMSAFIKESAQGSLPREYSFVSTDCENIIVEAVKMAEEGDYIIVRAYECYNRRCEAGFKFNKEIAEIYECDMLEKKLRECAFNGSKAFVSINPYEIKTFKLRLV